MQTSSPRSKVQGPVLVWVVRDDAQVTRTYHHLPGPTVPFRWLMEGELMVDGGAVARDRQSLRQRLPTKSGDTSPALVEGASLRVDCPCPPDTSSGLRPPSPRPTRRR